METRFYEFRQNNSGGSFVVDDKLCARLFIEATSTKKAKKIAKGFGVYFNGVYKGIDCSCCGDRWSKPSDYDIVDLERLSKSYSVEFKTIEEYVQLVVNRYTGWTKPSARLFYLDGTVKEFNDTKSEE